MTKNLKIKSQIKSQWDRFSTALPSYNSVLDQSKANLLLTDQILDLLTSYFILLEHWNSKTDLVSPAPMDILINRHVIDCLATSIIVQQVIQIPFNFPYMDVGSGAGLPGLILSITEPNRKIFLCEPRQKRVSFLNNTISELGLTQTDVLDRRLMRIAEKIQPKSLGLIITRALERKNDREFFEYGTRLIDNEGFIAKMAGPSFDSNQILNNLTLSTDIFYKLPLDSASRRLVVWKCFT